MRLVRPRSVPAVPVVAGANLGSVGYGGASLTSSGSLTASADGATIQNLDLTGTITVQAAGVTIRNCRITGTGQQRGIDTFGATGNVTVQDCTFLGDFDDAGLSGPLWTATRCEFSGMTNDAVKMGDDTTLTNSWIHSFNTVFGGHGDGIQGVDTPHRVLVSNCLIDLGLGGPSGVLPNSAVIITPWTIVESGPGSISFDRCTFGGGGYTFHVDTGFTEGISVTNCRFLSDYDRGPIYNVDLGVPVPAPAVWVGNVDAAGVPLAWTFTA